VAEEMRWRSTREQFEVHPGGRPPTTGLILPLGFDPVRAGFQNHGGAPRGEPVEEKNLTAEYILKMYLTDTMNPIRLSNTDYALLGMLSVEPMSGYQIRQEIEESIAYFWTESYGQIYPALKRLAAGKFITPVRRDAGERGKGRVFSLTAQGKAALTEWLAQAPDPQPPRNQLLLKLFFGRAVSPDVCLMHLTQFRERMAGRLLTYRQLRQDIDVERTGHPDVPYWLMTIRHGELQARAQVQWCDESIDGLTHAAKSRRKVSPKAGPARGKESHDK
jgi:PadR family transcriptional regulator AphA